MKIETYLKIAEDVASESKCASMGVGCVIVKGDKVIGTGYNGTVRGYQNCNELFDSRCSEHSKWSQKFEIHSEMNALANCDESVHDCTAIITDSPCFNCTKHLIAFGVKYILFKKWYDNYPEGEVSEIIDFCNKTGVHFNQIGGGLVGEDMKLADYIKNIRGN